MQRPRRGAPRVVAGLHLRSVGEGSTSKLYSRLVRSPGGEGRPHTSSAYSSLRQLRISTEAKARARGYWARFPLALLWAEAGRCVPNETPRAFKLDPTALLVTWATSGQPRAAGDLPVNRAGRPKGTKASPSNNAPLVRQLSRTKRARLSQCALVPNVNPVGSVAIHM